MQLPEEDERISWIDAFCAPKVLLYGFTFFCIKFSIYAILLWMPLFLNQELGFDNSMIAKLLTYYEISTLFGTMTLGLLTDLFYAKRSPVAVLFVICASTVAFMITYQYKDLNEV